MADAKAALTEAEEQVTDLSLRKEGEENLTENQVAARRSRERAESLKPLRESASAYERELAETIELFFSGLSRIHEKFDTTVEIKNRVLQHSQRRVDVYWRSAMRRMPDLPAIPSVEFSNVSDELFERHYNESAARAEILRKELESELNGEE